MGWNPPLTRSYPQPIKMYNQPNPTQPINSIYLLTPLEVDAHVLLRWRTPPPSIHFIEHKRKSQIKMQRIGILHTTQNDFRHKNTVEAAPSRLEDRLHTEIRKFRAHGLFPK